MPDAPPDARWVENVLTFWFDDLTRADWFATSSDVDARIAREFADTVSWLAAADIDSCLVNARTALAAIIALDQFPRNLYRGTARSFAYDGKARAISIAAIAFGFDEQLGKDERLFVYLPFEHSEAITDQERAVELIARLGDENYDGFAVAHRDIIARFGRFPHRNDALGRASTPEELAYLADGGQTFGVPTSEKGHEPGGS